MIKPMRPQYDVALKALKDAHAAYLQSNNMEIKIKESLGVGFNATGMSHGPFSGTNKVLGIISKLENENTVLFTEMWARTCP